MLDTLVNKIQGLRIFFHTGVMLGEEVPGEENGGGRLEVRVVGEGLVFFEEGDEVEDDLLDGSDLMGSEKRRWGENRYINRYKNRYKIGTK
jgi:hypothetical protein